MNPAQQSPRRGGWSSLGRAARLFRLAHLAWGIVSLASLGYIWAGALMRRRDPALYAAIGFLSLEGAALVVGRGNCPFGPLQSRLGDPMPMFELVLPPRAAKAAIPALAFISLAGMAAALARQPRAGSAASIEEEVGSKWSDS